VNGWLIAGLLYVAIPVVALWISGRQLSALGWLVFIAIWPVGWMLMGPEELP
jgi:hypothetical protein